MTNIRNIPATMQAVRVSRPVTHEALTDPVALAEYMTVDRIPVPRPGRGEVLVKVSRGTINPNDLHHVKGEYIATRAMGFPRQTGFEGAGIVVASGGGLVGRVRLGQRVAFYAPGMFAEYIICKAIELIVIPNQVDFEIAASAVANQVTASAMLSVARKHGSPAFINTAGASALGRLLIRQCHDYGLDIISIVRREDQAEICRTEGATQVLDSSQPDFAAELKDICRKAGCRLAFDCVAGDMPEILLNAMPDSSTVKIYGYLTPGPISVSPQSLFFGRQLETFEVNEYLAEMSLMEKFFMSLKVTKGMKKRAESTVKASFPLDRCTEAYASYSQDMTSGKVQIVANNEI